MAAQDEQRLPEAERQGPIDQWQGHQHWQSQQAGSPAASPASPPTASRRPAITSIVQVVLTALVLLALVIVVLQVFTLGQRLDAMSQRLDAVGEQFEAIDGRFDATDERLDVIATDAHAAAELFRGAPFFGGLERPPDQGNGGIRSCRPNHPFGSRDLVMPDAVARVTSHRRYR